jgi:hypothetical protein
MMLLNTQRPFAKPSCEWCNPVVTCPRVTLEYLPLVFGGSTLLVQDFSRNGQFPDVMQKRRPSQQRPLMFRKAHLFADHICKRANPFWMPPCASIVAVQYFDENQYLLSGSLWVESQPVDPEVFNDFLNVSRVTQPKCNLEPRRRSVRKRQIHMTQGRQGN